MPNTTVLIASDDQKIRESVRLAAQSEGLESILCGDGEEALESAKKNSLETGNLKLLVMEAFLPDMDGFEIINRLAEYPHTRDLPVLMLIGPGATVPNQFTSTGSRPANVTVKFRLRADNYLQKPFDQTEIKSEIHSMIKHFRAHNAPHPVTGLMGHPQAEQEVFSRLNRGEVFSMLWMDINHFRPYNDHYGAERGNGVLKMTVKLAQDIARSAGIKPEEPNFLAHVDGDDFIYILPGNKSGEIKQYLRERFQIEVQKFYTTEEREKGFFIGKGRDQKDQIFPIMSLSMIELNITLENFIHYGQLVSASNELLRQAKVGAQDVK